MTADDRTSLMRSLMAPHLCPAVHREKVHLHLTKCLLYRAGHRSVNGGRFWGLGDSVFDCLIYGQADIHLGLRRRHCQDAI